MEMSDCNWQHQKYVELEIIELTIINLLEYHYKTMSGIFSAKFPYVCIYIWTKLSNKELHSYKFAMCLAFFSSNSANDILYSNFIQNSSIKLTVH